MRRALLIPALLAVFGCHVIWAPTRSRRPAVMTMTATAFTRARQATAAGTAARAGTVAADPKVLPLGSKIRVTGSKGYDGNYLVTDTGSDVKGRHIDLYLPSPAAAQRFGAQTVRVQIRELGNGPEDARAKDRVARRRLAARRKTTWERRRRG